MKKIILLIFIAAGVVLLRSQCKNNDLDFNPGDQATPNKTRVNIKVSDNLSKNDQKKSKPAPNEIRATAQTTQATNSQTNDLIREKKCVECKIDNLNIARKKLGAINLSGSSIHKGSFFNVELENSNFTNTSLSDVVMTYTYLKKSDFSNSNLDYIKAKDTHFNYVNFTRSTVTNSDFKTVQFSGAIFDNAKISDTSFKKVHLTNSSFRDSEIINTNFEEANLRRATFTGAKLIDINFQKAVLASANFSNADLREIDFSEAYLKFAKFKGSDLRGANFLGAKYLNKADLTGANLCDAIMPDGSINNQCEGQNN